MGSYFIGAIINSFVLGRFANDQIDNQQKTLIDYIRSSDAKKISKEQIYKELRETGGWSDSEIDEAYKIIE
jgi:hypothetical protein